MAENESEYLQLRKEEIEILKSIYIDELLIRNNESEIAESIEIVLHPATAGQAHQQYVCLTLILNIPEQYPNVEPKITIKNPRGISDEFINSLKKTLEEHASENLGNAVLFSLIQHASDSLTYNNTPSCDCAVCLTGFQEEDSFTKTVCYHYFHISCLERYIDICTKDHEKHLAEIQESGTMPQQTPKELQIVCPVCREPISYQSECKNKSNDVKPTEDDVYEPDESMREWQEKMRRLYKKQEDQGGIIDVEAERNRFLLDISTTVVAVGDTKNSSASKTENCSEQSRSKSRRENTNKYGNRTDRCRERKEKSNKMQRDFSGYRHKEGHVSNKDYALEKVDDEVQDLKSNCRNEGQDVRSRNNSPVEGGYDDLKSEKENKEVPLPVKLEDNCDLKQTDDQIKDGKSAKESGSCDTVSEIAKVKTLGNKDSEKDMKIEIQQLNKDEKVESIQKSVVQDEKKSTNVKNEKIEKRNNGTGEKLSHWRIKNDNYYGKNTYYSGRERSKLGDAKERSNQRGMRDQNERPKSGGAMGRNEHTNPKATMDQNDRPKSDGGRGRNEYTNSRSTKYQDDHPRSGRGRGRNEYNNLRGGNVRPKSEFTRAKNESKKLGETLSKHELPKPSGTKMERDHLESSNDFPEKNRSSVNCKSNNVAEKTENQNHTNSSATSRKQRETTTTSEKQQQETTTRSEKCLSESTERSDRLKGDLSNSTNHIEEEVKCKNFSVVANDQIQKKKVASNNRRQFGESIDVKNCRQTHSGHQRYRNQRQKQYPESKQKQPNKDIKLCNSAVETESKISSVGPPPGFQSKNPILPPPGF